MTDYTNRVAFVSAGATGIGYACAEALVQRGAKVMICARREDTLQAAVKKLGENASYVVCDVSERDQMEAAIAATVEKYGKLDFAVNSAGVGVGGTILDLDDGQMDACIKTNVNGTIYAIQAQGKAMRENGGGSIVNISSMAAQLPLTRVVGYSASKAAVDNFTRWLAVELAVKYGGRIRVNAIAPGFFIAEQNRSLLLKEDNTLTDRGNTIISQTPMRRFGEPDELISTLLWLCDDRSAFVTGIVVPVDGGFSAFSGV